MVDPGPAGQEGRRSLNPTSSFFKQTIFRVKVTRAESSHFTLFNKPNILIVTDSEC